MARGIRRLTRPGRRRGTPPAGPETLRSLLDSLPLTLRRQALRRDPKDGLCQRGAAWAFLERFSR